MIKSIGTWVKVLSRCTNFIKREQRLKERCKISKGWTPKSKSRANRVNEILVKRPRRTISSSLHPALRERPEDWSPSKQTRKRASNSYSKEWVPQSPDLRYLIIKRWREKNIWSNATSIWKQRERENRQITRDEKIWRTYLTTTS